MTRTHISILSLKFLFCPFRLHRKTFPAPEKAPLEEILEVRLKQLDLDDGHGITMSWLCQAMEILSMTYTKATAMVPNSNVPEKWFHSFLENSLELLDLCNSISSTLSRLQNKCLSIKHALHLIDHQISNFQSLENLNGAHKALLQWMLRPPRKSRTCQSSTHPQKCPPLSKSLHAQTLYIVETITHFFTRGVAASLLASGVVLEELGQFFGGSGVICKEMANISSRSGVVLEELGQFLDRSGVVLEESGWFFSGSGVVLKELGRFSGRSGVVLEELKVMDECVRKFLGAIERGSEKQNKIIGDEEEREELRKAVKEVEEIVEVFSEGLDSLLEKVNGFFHLVLCARNSMLDNIRQNIK